MQPPFSFKLDLNGSSRALGTEENTSTTSSSLLHLGEKQLFEKFWKGTFKAVATPRPESVIVASITSSRRVMSSEPTASCLLQADDRKAADTQADIADRNGCIKGSRRKRHGHRRARVSSFDGHLSPRRKGKKKKRKSERKRKRRRSPSQSLSPVRKNKKKKKKSSKKSKRHRYTSKKSKHSSSSLKRKRKDERKHKKSSRTHSHRRRRYRRLESDSSSCRSFTGDRHLQKSVVHQAFRDIGRAGEETQEALNPTESKWRRTTKSVCKTAPKYRSILSAGTILPSKPGSKLLNGNGAQDFSSHTGGPRDYDSGNDTSSPPSSKTGVSRASVVENQRSCQHLTSPPEKHHFADRDNGSDSGNSVTSYASSCKPYRDDGFSATLFSGNSKSTQISLGCEEEDLRCRKTARCTHRRSRSYRKRFRKRTLSFTSRSRSSVSSRYSGRHSRSTSLSSCSSYSTSLSYSSDTRRRGSLVSLSSRESYSKYSAHRRDRKRRSSSREKDMKHRHKVSGKRRRRKSYSPMRKRRRDSPSHLEARRITSARKRPIPYFRPSPSSSNRSTSVSSWSSLFTRSRSRSPIYSIRHSRSHSRSFSSYRSYSRSSSWNSIFGSHSRSRSRLSLKKRRKTRR
ncbi:serine/arginine repetitive matrix protein 4 isoform X2 [Cyprinodon tularosa]|uniref:serine/arginine repetitive matrix protein 4 isoform X2 n=1 Tax=Cyprinodon tularosa TaxID=77115 RepID=UPI0018E2771C|nr:serine/arginine repetitive matrix protein 4 isoform X2 [Cyprinodon tularosa]